MTTRAQFVGVADAINARGLGANLGPFDAEPWPSLDPAALRGIAGEVVRTIEPHTESDPVAILATLLVMFGSVAGDGPHFIADGARHTARLFALLVGHTSKARKGSAYRQVRNVIERVDPVW